MPQEINPISLGKEHNKSENVWKCSFHHELFFNSKKFVFLMDEKHAFKWKHMRTHVGLSTWLKTTICHGTLTNFQLSQERNARMKRVEKWNEFFIQWEIQLKNRPTNKICHEYLSLKLNWNLSSEKNLGGTFFISKPPGNNESVDGLSSVL